MSDLLQKYQDLINQTKIYPREIGIEYCCIGLGGEGGEILNKLKKVLRDKGGVFDDEVKLQLMDEASDVLWYVTALAQELGFTLDQVMEHNIQKLMGRRERGTLSGSGDNR